MDGKSSFYPGFWELRLSFSVKLIIVVINIFGFNHDSSGQTEVHGIESQELIFPLQDKHVHGSSIVALPSGDILACWFEGSGERMADDVKIMGARKQAEQSKWSPPFLMVDTRGMPDCNPVLFLSNNQTLFLFWIAVQANRWETSIIRYRTSQRYNTSGAPQWDWQDNILLKPTDLFAEEVRVKLDSLVNPGHGWAEYAPPYNRMIVEAAQDIKKRSLGWMTRIKPLQLLSGKLVLPLYSDGFNMSLMALSDDEGATWYPSRPVVGKGNIQPAILAISEKHLIAYMRDAGDAPGRIQISESRDQGMTWSPARKSQLPNTASVEILKLSSGPWLLLGNDVSDGRYQLSLYSSEDGGEQWNHLGFLEKVDRGEGRFSYPALIEDSSGLIHISYSYHLGVNQKSIKYVRLNPEMLIP